MTKEQKRIAAMTIADIVRDAVDSGKAPRPAKKVLKRLARDAAAAMAAGIKTINACGRFSI